MLRNLLLALVTICISLQAEEPEAKQTPQQAEITKYLLQAAESFDKVEASNDPRTLSYIYARERISHHPLLYVTSGLVRNNADDEALRVAKLIKEPVLQAYALIRIAEDQVDQSRMAAADSTLKFAVEFLKSKIESEEQRNALQSPLNNVLLKRYQKLEKAVDKAKELGLNWKAEDKDDHVITIARFQLDQGKLQEARKTLQTLPAKTYSERRGQNALANNDGAGFYEWIGRSVSDPESYGPDHLLLEWLEAEDSVKLLEEFLGLLQEDSVLCYQTLGMLADRYQKEEQKEALKAILERKSKFETRLLEKIPEDKRETIQFAQRLSFCEYGQEKLEQFFTDGKLQERYRKLPAAAALIPLLCKQHQPVLAEDVAKDRELDEQTHALLAIAWHEAKQPEKAKPHMQQLKSPLALPRFTVVLSMVYEKQGDKKLAAKTLAEGIELLEKVRATNNWFPPPDQVKHEAKWHAMTYAYQLAVQQDSIEPFLEDPSRSVSIRALGMSLGEKNDKAKFEKLLNGLATRDDGSRTYALIGFSQGLARNQKTEQSEKK